jgi:hypothetical protein
MASVYIVRSDGVTDAMDRVRCKDEDRELQVLLEKNWDLLPGDQIDPDDPRRWLLVKREMAVPDPKTGADRWSIDFFFVDQDAVPTFVECKRFEDTRSRREIVGQMLEYAANGHYYWSKDLIRELAEQSSKQRGSNLEESLEALHPNDGTSTDLFFEKVQENLREAQLRVIFFLEESPVELRSVVDFLNKQMERSEVLLVEARQYTHNDFRVVVPVLFGYTDQARMVKRSVTVTPVQSRKRWDKDLFFADASQKLRPEEVQAVASLFEGCVELGFEIAWGSGKETGSYSIKDTSLAQRSLLTVYSNGTLALNFGWLNETEKARKVRSTMKELVVSRLGVSLPEDLDHKYPSVPIDQWAPKVSSVIQLLKEILDEVRKWSA